MSRSFGFRCTVHVLIGVLYAQTIWAAAPPRRPAAPAPAAMTTAVSTGVTATTTALETTQEDLPPVPLFEPERFTRTWGLFPDCFVRTFTVPAWATSPYKLRILNGEPNGENRVILAGYVEVNDEPIVGALDILFSHHVIERWITVTPGSTATLKIALWSLPGSYLTVSLHGSNGDAIAPAITVTSPAAGAVVADATPDLAVTYADTAGGGQASGIDPATFRATLDGVDRTSLFTTTATDATATVPEAQALADGPHTLRVEVKDRAGNVASEERAFTILTAVDPPSITIGAPAEGSLVQRSPVTVTGTVREHAGGTLAVQCRSGATAGDAQVTGEAFTCAVPLAEGANTIEVSATDSRNQTTRVSRSVRLDSIAPTLTIAAPLDNSYTADASIAVSGTVDDANAVTVKVNGTDATVTGQQFELGALPVGSGSTLAVAVVAEDAAGNRTESTVTVRVVRTPLTVAITSPASGAVLPGPMVAVQGTTSQDLPVNVDVNGETASVQDGQFTAQVPLLEGPQTLRATARDAAGRTATHEVSIRIDSAAPAITISEPASGFITNANVVRVAGTVADASNVTLQIGGQTVPVVGGQFSTDVPLPSEGPATLTVTATDVAGNASTSSVDIMIDRTAPALAIVAPTANALVSGLPVIVQGTVTDATEATVTVDDRDASRAGDVWQASFEALPDGPRTFTAVARDAAGNTSTKTVSVTLDTAPPVITVTAPAPGTLTRAATVDVIGTVQDTSAVTVTVAGRAADVTGQSFTALAVPIDEGDTPIVVRATDATGRTTETSVVVTRDSTAPQIDLGAPERITRRQAGQAVATVTDAGGVAQVVFAVEGAPAGTFTAAPFAIDLAVPANVALGGTFEVQVTATDRAGNVATAMRGVRVAADGAIVGQVLSDVTGLPLEGATVRIGADTRTTDTKGRYTLPTEQASIAIAVEQDGMTAATRTVSMQSGVGTVPVDVRLTPLASAVTIGAEGGTLRAPKTGGTTGGTAASAPAISPVVQSHGPAIVVTVPAGAVPGATAFHLTALSAQGLPDLLPLGWSPLASFDLRSAADPQGALDLRVTLRPDTSGAPPPLPASLTLVQYRPVLHAWAVVARDLTPAEGGVVTTTVPAAGTYALVAADVQDPPMVVPAVGELLTSVPVQALPAATTSRGSVEPGVIPPTGGTAVGRLRVETPQPLPSGTLVQAEIAETFTLPSGQIASEEQRRADLVLYRTPTVTVSNGTSPSTPDPDPGVPALGALFPIAPSRTFDPTQLVEGRVHLDILAGREAVRGTTGGHEAVTVTDGDARLAVPAGALTRDTAITIARTPLSPFLPTHAALTALTELTIDVAGQTLTMPAELSIAGDESGGPSASHVITRVERLDGVPHLTVVALADLVDGRIVARAVAGLPGITQGGRYVVYRVSGPVGLVTGLTRAADQPIASVLTSDLAPFVARAGANGRYALVTLAGAATITAHVPHTSLRTQATTTVSADQPATLDLTLAAQVTTATVTPADGARGVVRHTQVVVTTSAPIEASTVAGATVQLVETTSGTAATLRAVLAGSGQTLSFVPATTLAADASYRFELSGLIDIYGNPIVVPVTTFRTRAESAPQYRTEALTATFPDENGVVTLSAPENSFPAGTQFMVINGRSGEVLSFRTQSNGAASGTLRATIDDRLIITITDPDGRVTTITRSQFVDEATGRTAIGPGGGVVEGPPDSKIALRVPEGAVTRGVVLKLTPLDASAFDVTPDVPQGHFGSGLRIEASDGAVFDKEVDVVFPVPAEAITATQAAGKQPSDAFFYVFRRVFDTNGEPVFETVDWAAIEGEGTEARVVTQSFPFAGYEGFAAGYAFVMWSFDQALPGVSTMGTITGQVLRPTYVDGSTTPVYVGVEGVQVEVVDNAGHPLSPRLAAVSQEGGRYTIFDHHFTSGSFQVQAKADGETVRMPITPVQRADSDSFADPALQILARHGWLRQLATANLTLPLQQPQPPAPALTIRVFKTVDGRRVDTRGLAVEDTELTIGVSATSDSPATIRGIAINGQDHGLQTDPLAQTAPRDPQAMDVILSEPFVPAQPGTYTVEATALPPFGPTVRASITFRVVGAGGGIDTDNGAAPAVITAQTVPRAGATGVPVTVFPQVAFTEPVKNIPQHVQVLDPDGNEISIRISGIGVDAGGQPVVIEDVTDPEQVVTALTLQPRLGLAYRTRYRIVLTNGIVDLDTNGSGAAEPKALVPFESDFTTFGPEPLGGSETQFASPGLIVLGDRAYVLETMYGGGVGGIQNGWLRTFDVSDPIVPVEVPPAFDIAAPPRDIAGEEQTVVVATMPRTAFVPSSTSAGGSDITSGPANLLVFDVSGATPQWVGAASLTDSIMDGAPNRIVVKDGLAYSATGRKGIQVVDLGQTSTDLIARPAYEQFRDLYAPGASLNRHAVVATIPIPDPAFPQMGVWLNDLEVGDYRVEGIGQRLVLATGYEAAGLAVVNPVSSQVVWRGPLQSAGGRLTIGQAIALAGIAGRDLAIVGGIGIVDGGGSSGVLAIVDLGPLANAPRGLPQVLAWMPLTHAVGDILIVDQTAIVSAESSGAGAGTATLINLADPLHPQRAGTLTGVGSRLALTDQRILLSVGRELLRNASSLGNMKTAALGSLGFIRQVTPFLVPVDQNGATQRPLTVRYQLLSPPEDLANGRVVLKRDNQVVASVPVTQLTHGIAAVTVPAGVPLTVADEEMAIRVIRPDGSKTPPLMHPIVPIDDGNTSPGGQILPPAQFESIEPARADAGRATDLTVTVRGTGLDVLRQVVIGDGTGQWHLRPVVNRAGNGTQLTFVLPATLFESAGFLRIGPSDDPRGTLAFLVADATLPAPGTASDVRVDAVEPEELGPGGGVLTLRGSGFVEGTAVVLGRGTTSGVRLGTALVDDGTLEVFLPEQFTGRATDLFVAASTADGAALSAPRPVRATVADVAALDRSETTAGVSLVRATGTVAWNAQGDQELTLEGQGLVGDMEVEFTTRRGTVTARTQGAAAMRAAAGPTRPTLGSVRVTVPRFLTLFPVYCFALEAESRLRFAAVGEQCIAARVPPRIPLGGRLKFSVYRENNSLDGAVHILAERDPARGPWALPKANADGSVQVGADGRAVCEARPAMRPILPPTPRNIFSRLTPVTGAELATILLEGNATIPNPADATLKAIPLVEKEGDRCDPNHPHLFYLRAVRPVGTGERLVLKTSAKTSTGGTTTDEIEVGIRTPALGDVPKDTSVEPAIVKAAEKYGVPPQFLKAQAQKETHFNKKTYRYEPVTIDFRYFGKDGPEPLISGERSIVDRHLLRLEGAGTNNAGTDAQAAIMPQSPVPFVLPGRVRGRSGEPIDDARRLRAARGLEVTQTPTQFTIHAWYRNRALAGQPGGVPPLPALPPPVRAVLVRQTPQGETREDLVLVDPPVWRRKGRDGPTGFPNPILELSPSATLGQGEFSVDYGTNQLRLGRTLAAGMRVEVEYRNAGHDALAQTGACAALLRPEDLRSSLPSVTFRTGDTLAGWLQRNLQASPSGGFLNGTISDGMIEFAYDRATARSQPVVIDNRLHHAVAQFLAAGSFGPLQATLLDWNPTAQRTLLTKELDLTRGCLQSLADDVDLAFRVGALRHTASQSKVNGPACDAGGGLCDQLDWLRRWAKYIEGYNAGGPEYRVCDAYETVNNVRTCVKRKPLDLSNIAVEADRTFFAR